MDTIQNINNLFHAIGNRLFQPESDDEFRIHQDKLLSSFQNKRAIYEDFLSFVQKLVISILDKDGYKYQVNGRIKNQNSLKEKIARKRWQGKRYDNLDEIEDLVGVRVIFYSTKEIDSFFEELKKEISRELQYLEVKRNSGYSARHMIIKLGNKRLKLAEYQRFRGLKCELQITSAIHHAWAEFEHDIVHKDMAGLEKRDLKKFNSVKEKIVGILENYITKASEEFEEIRKEIYWQVK